MASNVILINCNETVVKSDIDNFTGVGLDENSTITSDTGNLYESVKISKEAGQLFYTTSVYQKAERVDSQTRTTSFTVDMTKGVYYIDTSGGDVVATWDTSTGNNWVVTFKITDATNSFIIDATGSPSTLLDGQPTPYVTGLTQYESITVQYNGTNLYIL